jgi:hypothetical protein
MVRRIALSPAREHAEKPEKSNSTLSKEWMWHLLFIIYSFEAGSFLVVFPWLRIWEDNYFLFRYPGMHPILNSLFVKGAVMGLGLVNIVIGVQGFVQLKKGTRGFFSQ